MIGRFLGIGRKNDAPSQGWAVAASASGDVLLSLPEGSGRFDTPIISVTPEGVVSVADAKGKARITLPPGDGLDLVAGSQSVILAAISKGSLSLSIAPVLKKGQKPQISFSKGKVHRVTVDRIADDGTATGVWRGFVTLHQGIREVFAEITPPFPMAVGSSMRIVGHLDSIGHGPGGAPRMRFRAGAWVPLADRCLLFTDGGTARITSSDGPGGQKAAASIETAISELAVLSHLHKGTKASLPMTRVRIGSAETPAQKSLRSRLEKLNTGIFKIGRGGGRRMKIPATEWHGSVQTNGDIVIEVRRDMFSAPPEKMTVIVNRQMVATSDGYPSRIGLRCSFRDGGTTMMLLGGGPQELAAEIARRKSVVIVQGMPGAESYADVHVSIAGVEKR